MTATDKSLRCLAQATDFEAVRVFEFFAKSINEKLTQSREELIENVPNNIRSVDGSDAITDIESRADESLSPGGSVVCARKLLLEASEDPGLAPLVKSCFADWKDERQLVEVVLAVGAVGSVWLILASSAFRLKDGHLEFEKKANAPEQLKAFAEVIRAIRGVREIAGGRTTTRLK